MGLVAINRQLFGWNLPPLMIRAFGAHGHKATSRCPAAIRPRDASFRTFVVRPLTRVSVAQEATRTFDLVVASIRRC